MSVRWRLCCCLGVWVCLLYNVPLTEGQFSVVGSTQPIVAVAGDDIVLPCHLEPALSAVDMTIEWSRPDLTPRYVHVHQDGRTLGGNQNIVFNSRTALFVDELKNGNVSLKLSRVRRSDEGRYRCFLPPQNSQGKESFVQLIVGAVSIPEISMVKNPDSGVDLQCESGGWYPEPEVEWLDSEGHVLSAGPTETLKDPDGTFTVRRLVTVEQTATNRFTCRVQQRHINKTREKEILIPDEVFQSSSSARDIGIGVSVAMVMLVLAGVVAFIVYRRKKAEHNDDLEKQRNEARKEREEQNLLAEAKLKEEGERRQGVEKEKEKKEEELKIEEERRKVVEEEKEKTEEQLRLLAESKREEEEKLQTEAERRRVAEEEKEAKEEELKALAERKRQAETKLLAQVAEKETELRGNQWVLGRREEELRGTQKVLELTKTELRATQEMLQRTQWELRGEGEELMRTQAELRGKEEELNTTKQDLRGFKGELGKTDKKLMTTQEELRGTKGNLLTTQGELQTAQVDLKDKEIELVRAQEELTGYKGELGRAQQELTGYKGELGRTQKELTGYKGELGRTQEELSQTKKGLKETEEKLKEALNSLTQTQNELQLTHSEGGQLVKRLRNEITVKDNELQEMKNGFAETKNQLQLACTEGLKLQTSLSEKENKLQQALNSLKVTGNGSVQESGASYEQPMNSMSQMTHPTEDCFQEQGVEKMET